MEMKKERFTVNAEKLNSLTFPQSYNSFYKMCYDIVLFDNAPCSAAQNYLLKNKSVRDFIREQLHDLTKYTFISGRPEKQTIHRLKNYVDDVLMIEELNGNADYSDLTPLLKDMINRIYCKCKDGHGEFVLTNYEIINELGIVGEYRTNKLKDINYKEYSQMVCDKFKDNIKTKINYYMKSINKKDVSLYQTATLDGEPLPEQFNKIYDEIYEQNKDVYYKKRYETINKQFNERIAEEFPLWKTILKTDDKPVFYRNWILKITPNFQPFAINENLNECRKQINKNLILKMKKDIGYKELKEFSQSPQYRELITQKQLEMDYFSFSEEEMNNKLEIIHGEYIPNHLKAYLFHYKDFQHLYYYNLYDLSSYLHDIYLIISQLSI